MSLASGSFLSEITEMSTSILGEKKKKVYFFLEQPEKSKHVLFVHTPRFADFYLAFAICNTAARFLKSPKCVSTCLPSSRHLHALPNRRLSSHRRPNTRRSDKPAMPLGTQRSAGPPQRLGGKETEVRAAARATLRGEGEACEVAALTPPEALCLHPAGGCGAETARVGAPARHHAPAPPTPPSATADWPPPPGLFPALPLVAPSRRSLPPLPPPPTLARGAPYLAMPGEPRADWRSGSGGGGERGVAGARR